ncbi:MAG: preprotein translocase subunit SecG [Candidatus Magasanikbacteria bacterium]|jgi:preprotein translocase subunit SecG|nr:preprotein translocase subunit SecG [Candidatus Magasanikbacteria bacterium]MBT4220731.1 preprotein translocase subunit SecG [Candidatus Magasanikbacteria bacterium]MBT4350076.1 preprotein translocase subunit SecG [Candidatus Magasanikbacteria bacterium]MBT4541481.1 preprotein translocase subunit SecG [Candidatus Magasanikbacteria bacterium]MBT6253009.1 preprotein translocase subunit SecG [Candidatus Magasanikbacteria bacterium]
MLNTVILFLDVIVGLVLIIAILLQQKGAGLGAGFGGSGGGGVVSTRRGVDLFLYKVTIVSSILFFVLAFLALFV